MHMHKSASLAVIAACCAPAIARGQAPRLQAWPAPWVAHGGPPLLLAPAAREFRLGLDRDSAAIRRTYWLEGGLIGGVLVGLVGSQVCKLGDRPPGSCYVEVFFLSGGLIGFPVGALIGGQFPKHKHHPTSP